MSEGKTPHARNIDALICSATWEIDPVYGQAELNRYLSDLDAVASGVPFSELGYSHRRESQRPQVLPLSAPARYNGQGSTAQQSAKQIMVLTLEGVMRSRDGLSSNGVNTLVSNLQSAEAAENIGGVILKVNSGGGESLAGTMLQSAIRDMTKPVLVLADFMASAAVRGTLDAPYVWATSRAAEIGSIGTMVSINREVAKYYRDNVEEIYAQQATDKNREWREYLAGNRAPLTEAITEHNEVFISEAREKRGIKDEALTGRMFHADKAQSLGLIDRVGTFKQAIEFLSGVILDAETQTGYQFSNTKNNSKMDFQTFFKPFAAAWSRITGNTQSADDLTPEAVLAEAEALDVVARSTYDEVVAQLQSEKDRATALETAQAANQQRISALEKELATLKADKADGFQTEKQAGVADLDPVNPMAGFVLTPQTSSKY